MIDRFYPKEDNRAKLILGISSEMPRRGGSSSVI
jgi:hypothetical protein